jgi:hypothetical protein
VAYWITHSCEHIETIIPKSSWWKLLLVNEDENVQTKMTVSMIKR